MLQWGQFKYLFSGFSPWRPMKSGFHTDSEDQGLVFAFRYGVLLACLVDNLAADEGHAHFYVANFPRWDREQISVENHHVS